MAPVAPVQWTPPPLPRKPAVPSCLDLKSHISTCSKTVLDRYNAAVEARNAAVRTRVSASGDYIQLLNHYTLAVNDYENCEVHRLNDALHAD